LFEDGTGAVFEYQNHKGFVPLPVQLIQNIAKQLSVKTNNEINIKLKSKYFINENNRLIDYEDNSAWTFFEKQQTESLNALDLQWKPYVYRSKIAQDDYLVYMAPDIASDASCVSCHVSYEYRAENIKARKVYGVAGQPILKLGHMIGMLEIKIKIKK